MVDPPSVDRRLLVLLGVPALAVCGLFVSQYWTVLTGEEVVIQVVEPVDPRDVFRGQYAVLRYTITTLDRDTAGGVDEGDTVYVTLEEDGEYWIASDVSATVPDATCIRGEVESISGGNVRVSYGIESFFAEPEEARRVERERRSDDVSGVVYVDGNCDSVLRGVRVGNETVTPG